jgi:peptidoglycan/LPS O-acetylase OafA/YrhL
MESAVMPQKVGGGTRVGGGVRVAGLDTLRAVAIVAVMAFHLSGRLPVAFDVAGRFGWMGVDLFFVLSGYLIGLQLLREARDGRGVGLGDFYRRRAYRILPAYLVVLGMYAVWPGWHEGRGMSPLWEFLTLTENLFVDYGKNHAFSHVWSLCVEEHFYLLLPLVVMAMMRRARVWVVVSVLVGLVACGMAVRWYELEHVLRPLAVTEDGFGVKYIERIYYPTYSRLDGLLAGVGLALVRVFRPGWWVEWTGRANGLLVGGAALVGTAVWMFWNRGESVTGVAAASTVVGFPLLSVGLAMWVVGASDAGCWLGRCKVPGARVVAMLAFSLYLTHKEVAHVVAEAWPSVMEARDWRCVPVYAVSCLAVAAVLYLGVERPMLWLRDKRARRVDVEVLTEPAL